MNAYGDITANGEAKNNFYIVYFTSVTYTLQEDMESNGSLFASGDLVFNAIYTSLGWHKSQFYVYP